MNIDIYMHLSKCRALTRVRIRDESEPLLEMQIGEALDAFSGLVRSGAVIFLSREQLEEHRAYLNELDIDQLFKETQS